MGPIDVVVLTCNSERTLFRCLQSVYDNVPVKRLIVIDAFSTDKTRPILNQFNQKYGNVKVICEKSSRGSARQRGIMEVQTDWFMFVDSDVVLCKNWFREAVKSIRSDVGAVWGVDLPGDISSKLLIGAMKRMEGRVFAIRGGCHDILLRRSAVTDIDIPSKLHVLEDSYIKEWIEGKNLRAVVSYSSFCRHYKQIDSLLSKENRYSMIFEIRNIKYVKERLVYAVIFALIWLLQQQKTLAQTRRPSALEIRDF